MITGLAVVALAGLSYGLYKHVTVKNVKAVVAKYEASAVAEVKTLVAELKAKL